MSANTLISIKGAQVGFKSQHLFSELDFDWEVGQQWAIVGDTGIELTAFLEVIRGNVVLRKGAVSRPFATAYMAAKSDAGEIHSYRDLISYVSQKYGFRNRSNQQNFYFQQRFNSSESEEAATVRECLEDVEQKHTGPWTLAKVSGVLRLDHLMDKSLLKLSNGETRRLALAMGLMKQPAIYLMDQPMTGLDVKSRGEFGQILKSIAEEGTHVLLTTNSREIPDGITHVGRLDGTGIGNVWEVKDFRRESHVLDTRLFNWELMTPLLAGSLSDREEVIGLDEVTIAYGEKKILDRLNWRVKPGERWLLKGPNGSGKSTLLSLLIGENPQAYAQNIRLFGRKRGTGESIWDVKKPTGFVAPELARFFPSNQTVRKVVLSGLFDTMGLFRKVTPEQEELARHWLVLFELEESADHLLTAVTLEHQRWALLARAMIKKPEVLILDEASQGMDEFHRRLFKRAVETICELTPLTLIFVSHYEEDIPSAVNQCLDLGKGTVGL